MEVQMTAAQMFGDDLTRYIVIFQRFPDDERSRLTQFTKHEGEPIEIPELGLIGRVSFKRD